MATAIIAQVSSLNFPPLRPIHRKLNHEQFVNEIRNLIADRQPAEIAERLRSVKLVYGCGDGSYRGICYYSAWKNGKPEPVDVVEIAASGEEHPVQLAGTTVHELGHVIAGKGHGHDAEWRKACDRLGLRLAKASGHVYRLAHFAPTIRPQIARLIQKLADGNPSFRVGHGGNSVLWGGLLPIKLRPCSLGVGTRGGKSRGKGSGSRLRLYACQCQPKPVKVRVAADEFKAVCLECNRQFEKLV